MQCAASRPFLNHVHVAGNQYGSGVRQGPVPQNDFVDHVPTLNTTVNPKRTLPAVALEIGAHFMCHISTASPATVSSGVLRISPGCRSKRHARAHIGSPFNCEMAEPFYIDAQSTDLICANSLAVSLV